MALTPEEMAAKAAEKEAKAKERQAEREAEKADKAAKKAAEKERLAAERAALKQQKEAEREAEKAELKAKREASKMPEQNGVRQPRPGTKTGKMWDLFNSKSTAEGRPIAISEVFDELVAKGHKTATIRTQYAFWRKFHGITGRIENPNKAPKPVKPAKAEAEVPAAETPVAEAPAENPGDLVAAPVAPVETPAEATAEAPVSETAGK